MHKLHTIRDLCIEDGYISLEILDNFSNRFTRFLLILSFKISSYKPHFDINVNAYEESLISRFIWLFFDVLFVVNKE